MQVVMPSSPPPSSLSKADLRKSNKPIMEKRRRARINQCLDELKDLILDAMKKDPSRHSKLEKADILEMTVKHLQEVQRVEMRSAVASDPSVLAKFQSGFSECAAEVDRYVGSLEAVDEGVKRRLLGHLTGCITGLGQVLPLAVQQQGVGIPSSGDVNNNNGAGRLQILSGLSLSRVGNSSPPPPVSHPPPSLVKVPSSGTPPPLHRRSAFSAVSRSSSSTTTSLGGLVAPPSPPASPPPHLQPSQHLFSADDDQSSSSDSSSSCPPGQELRVLIPQPSSLPGGHGGSEVRLLMEVPRRRHRGQQHRPDVPQASRRDMWRPW